MPYFWGSVCHIFCRNPLNLTDFYAIRTPIAWHILGAYSFANMGGGGGQNYFQKTPINAHSSTPTPVFLSSREETQTMVREKLGPKLRPPQTLYLLGKGETQTMVWVSGEGKLRPWSEFQTMVWVCVFGVGVDEGALKIPNSGRICCFQLSVFAPWRFPQI